MTNQELDLYTKLAQDAVLDLPRCSIDSDGQFHDLQHGNVVPQMSIICGIDRARSAVEKIAAYLASIRRRGGTKAPSKKKPKKVTPNAEPSLSEQRAMGLPE